MSNIDRQRISAVTLLESLGCVFHGGEWQGPPHDLDLTPEADLMHGLLITRADALEGFSCVRDQPMIRKRLAKRRNG